MRMFLGAMRNELAIYFPFFLFVRRDSSHISAIERFLAFRAKPRAGNSRTEASPDELH